jgi:peptide chain release factor 1
MTQDSDPDMRALAEADYASATTALAEAYTSLRTLLTPSRLSSDTHALVELSPGVGGLEAAHFTDDLGSMLVALAARHDWHCTVHRPDELDEATAGATATGETAGMSLQIKGDDAYNVLRLEAGVHRVQRVPATETKGRTHTSTAAIVVLPVPSASDRDEAPLYGPNDLVFTNMRSSGAGGQRTNKVETAVRIVHTPTGHAIKCQEYRMQMQVRALALGLL